MATKIEWTQETRNPVIGCTKVSPACDGCYAERMARRLSAMGQKDYGKVIGSNGKWNGKTVFRQRILDEMKTWKKPRSAFVVSMGDLFHKSVTDKQINKVLDTLLGLKKHTVQILTKRAERLPDWNGFFGMLPNVWVGVTCEDQQRADERIPYLLKTNAHVKFVSVEPMLGNISLQLIPDGRNCIVCGDNDHQAFECHHAEGKINWVICGGETGPGARRMWIAWAYNLMAQATKANVPFFFKGWGTATRDKKDPAYRRLANREWNEMPKT